MNDEEILGHLLKIEAEAAALVDNAQVEADRRIAEAEKRNRMGYEERYHTETARLEAEFQAAKEQLRRQYQKELEAYREKLSTVTINTERFSAYFNGLLAGES